MDFESIIANLKARNFIPHYCETAAEAKEQILTLVGNRSVGFGGSATIRDMGIYEALEENGNELHWHWKVPKEQKKAERDASIKADVFMSSANALLPDGRMINIDGTANRLAGLIYGPPTVICVIGRNKIVNTVDEGIERTKRECCPQNARRQSLPTPCSVTNECADCRCDARMCNVIAIHEWPTRPVKAFHVFVINEDLGL